MGEREQSAEAARGYFAFFLAHSQSGGKERERTQSAEAARRYFIIFLFFEAQDICELASETCGPKKKKLRI